MHGQRGMQWGKWWPGEHAWGPQPPLSYLLLLPNERGLHFERSYEFPREAGNL